MAGQPPNHDSNPSPLSLEELIALFVAFSVVGVLLWWSLGRRSESWTGQTSLLGTRIEQLSQIGSANGTPGVSASSPVEPGMAAPNSTATPKGVTNETATTIEKRADSKSTAAIPGPASTVAGPATVAPPDLSRPLPAATAVVPPGPTIIVPTTVDPTVTFPDVPPTHWAYPFVNEMAKRGMIAGVGDGTFKPDQPVNRAQYAALLSEVLSAPRSGKTPFSDVKAGFWATQSIAGAVEGGFVKGYPDQTFQPNAPMTKMQVLLSLANGFGLPKPAGVNDALQSFADRDQLPEWAKPAVAAATQAGVVVNYPDVNQFRPNQAATRIEVVAMLYQALKTTGQLPAIQSPYIVQP